MAVCLEYGQQQLRAEGRITGTVHFAYGMDNGAGDRDIRQYELTAPGGEEEEQELEKVRGYARRSGAQAVCIVTDLGGGGTADLFPGYDGALVVSAVSSDGEVGVMRPYRRSGREIELGAPKIAADLSITMLEGIF